MPAQAPAPAILSVKDLYFSWPQGPLFNGLSFELPAGVSLLLGEDGAGKTTLLKLLGGVLVPDSGECFLCNSTLMQPSEVTHKQVFWEDPQTDAHDQISAAEYLYALGQRYPETSADLLDTLIDGFDLRSHIEKPMYMLSTGSKRKVWISAAFAANAALTLIDQPFAALDAPSIRFLRDLLLQVSHQSDRAWLLADYTGPEGLTLSKVVRI